MVRPGCAAGLLAGAALLSSSLEVSALASLRSRRALAEQQEFGDISDVPSFYIYDHPAMTITNRLDNCQEEHDEWPEYVDVIGPLQKQLANHPRRALTGADADWFIVPFDFDLNEIAGTCNGTTAAERVAAALDALEASPHFSKHKGLEGKDHAITAMRHRIFVPPDDDKCLHYFPTHRRHLLRNMVVGHYADHHLNLKDKVYGFEPVIRPTGGWLQVGVDWKCTWLLPVQSAPDVYKDESFLDWYKRPNSIFYRGHGEPCRAKGAQELRESPELLRRVVPNIIVNNTHADSFEQYKQEITSSKFCLVMRCDDPQTSRFVDAMAAGCIPVLISEGLDLVAKPFSQQINYDAFTVTIEEKVWMEKTVVAARFAYNYPKHQLRRMYEALRAARAQVLWNHPQSQAATTALRELSKSCKEEEEEE